MIGAMFKLGTSTRGSTLTLGPYGSTSTLGLYDSTSTLGPQGPRSGFGALRVGLLCEAVLTKFEPDSDREPVDPR
jgi:hypothetical protein